MARTGAAPARDGRDVAAQLGAGISDVLRLFANVGFAVTLFAVWGTMTLLGVIVEQGREPAFYATIYAPPLARLVLRLHLDNIYHSPAYIGIIGLIVVSIVVATFKRVIPARLPPLRAVNIEAIPLHARVQVEGDEADVRRRVEQFFAGRGWQVRKRALGGVEWTFADKHNWARRGVLLAHLGFLVIAAGTTTYWAWGFSGETAIVSGSTQTIAPSGARLRLDRFGYRIDPIVTKSGLVYQPIDYVSYLHVVGRDGKERPAVLRVNQPIDIDGTLYYQATYGYAIDFALTKDGRPAAGAPAGPLKEGEAFAVGATSRTIVYAQFAGTLDRRTGGVSADPRANDPGVVLSVFDGDQMLGKLLVPLGEIVDLGGGYRVRPTRYTIYSGIQYRHDPGIALVGLGAFILLLGLCVSFYLVPARLYVRVDGAGRSWVVGLAATTVKGYDIFELQFRELVAALGRSAGGVTGPADQGRTGTHGNPVP